MIENQTTRHLDLLHAPSEQSGNTSFAPSAKRKSARSFGNTSCAPNVSVKSLKNARPTSTEEHMSSETENESVLTKSIDIHERSFSRGKNLASAILEPSSGTFRNLARNERRRP
jgi:hypothetical protein